MYFNIIFYIYIKFITTQPTHFEIVPFAISHLTLIQLSINFNPCHQTFIQIGIHNKNIYFYNKTL